VAGHNPAPGRSRAAHRRSRVVDRRRAAVFRTPAGDSRLAHTSRAADQPSNQAAGCSPDPEAVRHGLHPVGARGISQCSPASRPAPAGLHGLGCVLARSVSAMAELKARLRADLTQAMKTQDKLRTATLRLLLAAIQTEEVSGKQARDLSDEEIIKVLARESRKRAEAAEIYTQNGRGELAANEHAEARVIDEYLPTPLTEAEVADVVDTAIAQVAEAIGERPGMKQMGQVMKAATAIAAGKADGARLSAAVKERL
jgi:uncharacterized protein YqeY